MRRRYLLPSKCPWFKGQSRYFSVTVCLSSLVKGLVTSANTVLTICGHFFGTAIQATIIYSWVIARGKTVWYFRKCKSELSAYTLYLNLCFGLLSILAVYLLLGNKYRHFSPVCLKCAIERFLLGYNHRIAVQST